MSLGYNVKCHIRHAIVVKFQAIVVLCNEALLDVVDLLVLHCSVNLKKNLNVW